MWLMPYGSFYPLKLGFWLAIFNAAVIGILTSLFISKYSNSQASE